MSSVKLATGVGGTGRELITREGFLALILMVLPRAEENQRKGGRVPQY